MIVGGYCDPYDTTGNLEQPSNKWSGISYERQLLYILRLRHRVMRVGLTACAYSSHVTGSRQGLSLFIRKRLFVSA